jgi:hypothetical protein
VFVLPRPLQNWIQPPAWNASECPAKVIPVNDLTAVLESLVRVIPPDVVLVANAQGSGSANTASAPGGGTVSAASAGASPLALAAGLTAVGPAVVGPGGGIYVQVAGNAEPPADPRFGVLGQGYNVFEGERRAACRAPPCRQSAARRPDELLSPAHTTPPGAQPQHLAVWVVGC